MDYKVNQQQEYNDEELIQLYNSGDNGALDILFERYRRPFYSYFNRLFGGDTSTADDVFQETWLRIIKALPKFQHTGSFSAWAFRIAHNQAMQSFRKTKVRSKVGAITPTGDIPETPAASMVSPDNILNDKDLADKINAVLNMLPEEQREVFTLRQQGVSFKEIADMQNCSINTALSRMRYVIIFMRKKLSQMIE